MGTTTDFFRHYQYAGKRSLEFTEGREFSDLYDTVIGAEVAEKLGYTVGKNITLASMGISSYGAWVANLLVLKIPFP